MVMTMMMMAIDVLSNVSDYEYYDDDGDNDAGH